MLPMNRFDAFWDTNPKNERNEKTVKGALTFSNGKKFKFLLLQSMGNRKLIDRIEALICQITLSH